MLTENPFDQDIKEVVIRPGFNKLIEQVRDHRNISALIAPQLINESMLHNGKLKGSHEAFSEVLMWMEKLVKKYQEEEK